MLLLLVTQGIPANDIALFIPRFIVGVFFAMSGFNKLFTNQGHKNLIASLTGCQIPFVSFFCWWVAFWECFGGLAYAIGFLTAFHAAVLIIVCIVATVTTGPRKVNARSNFNTLDRATNWLFLPEILLMALLFVSVFSGSGKFSIDTFIQ
jgi:putative oxidoreductase